MDQQALRRQTNCGRQRPVSLESVWAWDAGADRASGVVGPVWAWDGGAIPCIAVVGPVWAWDGGGIPCIAVVESWSCVVQGARQRCSEQALGTRQPLSSDPILSAR